MPDGKGMPLRPLLVTQAHCRSRPHWGVDMVRATPPGQSNRLAEINSGVSENAMKVAKTFHIHRLIPGNDTDSVNNLSCVLDESQMNISLCENLRSSCTIGLENSPEG